MKTFLRILSIILISIGILVTMFGIVNSIFEENGFGILFGGGIFISTAISILFLTNK